MSPAPDRYLLLLGSNIEREGNLERAAAILAEEFEVIARSRTCESDAVGDPSAPAFLNRAMLVRSALAPRAMQERLRAVEHSLGRVRTADRNAARTIDIDILCALDAAGAPLPAPPVHRDLARHHHAAIPAAEIAGAVVLPGGTTIAAAAAALGPVPPGFRVLPA